MRDDISLDDFIARLAKKIVILYPSNCADIDDYIQTGHLKLIEINNNICAKRDFKAYAIIAIARAMRDAALKTMCAASAPIKIKKLVHRLELLLIDGQSEEDIQKELVIDQQVLSSLKSLLKTDSWHNLTDGPYHEEKPFSVLNDLLDSEHLNDKDKNFIKLQFSDDDFSMTRKQKWTRMKNIRNKLIRSGYGFQS